LGSTLRSGLAATFKFIRDPANRRAVVETTDTPADIAQQTLTLFFERREYSAGRPLYFSRPRISEPP
jgi:hypothetical protein